MKIAHGRRKKSIKRNIDAAFSFNYYIRFNCMSRLLCVVCSKNEYLWCVYIKKRTNMVDDCFHHRYTWWWFLKIEKSPSYWLYIERHFIDIIKNRGWLIMKYWENIYCMFGHIYSIFDNWSERKIYVSMLL
jgi:hypothetical protein